MLKTGVSRVITLVFLFLPRCSFPTQYSISIILRMRYGESLAKSMTKLEKLDFIHKKVQLDLEFLQTFIENNVIQNFLRFKVANRHLSLLHAYDICQKTLLNEEISNKYKLVRTLAFNLKSLKNDLKRVFSNIDFAHGTTVFLTSKNKSILKV